MQCQIELMELLVKHQQQAGVMTDTTGLQNILQVPIGQAPSATSQFQVLGAQHFFVPGAPFVHPFSAANPCQYQVLRNQLSNPWWY